MPIPDKKIVTYTDLQTLIDTEGFVMRNSFPTTSLKRCNKVAVKDALFVDPGPLVSSGNDQLIAREKLVSTGALTAYSSSTNEQPSSGAACSDPVDTTYYHDGAGAYPVVGDKVYEDLVDTPLPGTNEWYNTGGITLEILAGEVITETGCA